MMTKEEHDAVIYRRTWVKGINYNKHDFFPSNLVAATPFRFLGIFEGFKLTLAKADYPWQCSCSYTDKKDCRAKTHEEKEVTTTDDTKPESSPNNPY